MNNKPVQIVAWAWSLLACASFAWAYFHLTGITNKLGELYAGLDVELPLLVRLVLSTHVYVYPLFFGSAAIIIVVKEIIMRNKMVSLVTTLAAMVGVFAMVGWINIILYSPIIDISEKLSK